jgi:L-alanine-DL-glutamate epimerase-like enolase superfamily enzyme
VIRTDRERKRVPAYFVAEVSPGEGRPSKANLFRDKLTSWPYEIGRDGCVRPPERPGIGLEVNEEYSKKHPVIEGSSYV